MKKPTSVQIILLILLALVGVLFALPLVRSLRLEKALSTATDAKAAASIARTMIKSNSKRGIAAVARYANRHESCAFDATRNLLLLCDDQTGEVHIVYFGPEGTPASIGDTSIDELVVASFSIDEPPRLFSGIHLLSRQKDRTDFILRPKTGSDWYRYSVRFSDRSMTARGLHGVGDSELHQWRRNEDWPQSWN